jgi:histidinol-phosphate aminotransferase
VSVRSPRIHGGPDGLGVPLHDFSTNSNACGPCPVALAAVRQADATRYPDAGYTALRARLAAFHGVDETRVLLAASASEFIFRITALAAGQGARAVWLPPMAYGDYAQAATAHRLAQASEPGDAHLLWACEPSSPLGSAQEGLAALAGGRPAQSLLVLDRAYEPLRLSAAPTLTPRQIDATWQLWTPNKALGLTGVRAAYVIAPLGQEDHAAALEQLCPSWPVGAHGEAMLTAWAANEAQDWLAASLKTLREWKARQIAVCESLGWHCLTSEANFFCAQPALPEGMSLQAALAALRVQGIKLRDTTSFGLPGHVRLGVQPPAVQDALHNAWQQLFDTR